MKLCKSIITVLFLIVGIVFLKSADGRPVNSEIVYDATDGILDGQGIMVASNHEGYTGDVGFVDFGGIGTSVSWLVDIAATGFYKVAIRYASTVDRGPLDLVVDGIELGSYKIKKVADNWVEWKIETIKVYITAGENQNIKILASHTPGPNVDKIIIVPDYGCKNFQGKEKCKEHVSTIFCKWKSKKNKCIESSPCTSITGTEKRAKRRCKKNPRSCIFDKATGCTNNNDDVSLGPSQAPPPDSVRPTVRPTVRPIVRPSTRVLASNQKLFERNNFISSPNGKYEVGLDSEGKLVMREGGRNIWVLQDKKGNYISNVAVAGMQIDGNLVLRTSSREAVWDSETSNNYGSEFYIDDGGRLSIIFEGTLLWIDGLPLGTYTGASSADLTFPVRGFFYYAWYPETWVIGGKRVKYTPNLGSIGEKQYKSGDPIVAKSHVKALDYALADLSIVSWWGPSDRLDRARITQLLDETVAQQSAIKWTVYYEDEMKLDNTVDELVADLNYLKEWFAWHESWAHKDGKPVIFIWNESDCNVADRWVDAANKAGGWYVVPKLFGGFDECNKQPDSWHQYGVSDSYLEYQSYSFTIGPGFYKANADEPRYGRVSKELFCKWVLKMNESKHPWNLIVSFNEWGEGTAVESAVEWKSETGYGIYLDCLHDPVKYR